MVANFAAGGAAINQLARVAGAELDVVPLDARPSHRRLHAGAGDGRDGLPRRCRRRLSTRSPPDFDLLCFGEMGIGNTTAAAAIAAALFGGGAARLGGRGTGVDDAGLTRKRAAIEAGARPPCRGARRPAASCCGTRRARTRGDPRRHARRPPCGASRCCSTASSAPPPRPPLAGCDPAALDHCHRRPLSRPNPAIAACSKRSACRRCSISACGWAKPPAPRSPCRSSARRWPATTAWRLSRSAGCVGPGVTPRGLVAALLLLTRLPVGRLRAAPPGEGVWAFPMVGALVGGLGGAAFWAARALGLPVPLASILVPRRPGAGDGRPARGRGRRHRRCVRRPRHPGAAARDHARQPDRQLRCARAAAGAGHPRPAIAAIGRPRGSCGGAGGERRGRARGDAGTAAVAAAGAAGRACRLARAALARRHRPRTRDRGPRRLRPAAAGTGGGHAGARRRGRIGFSALARRLLGGHTGDVLGACEQAAECAILSLLAAALAR